MPQLNFSSTEMREIYESVTRAVNSIVSSTTSQINSDIYSKNKVAIVIDGTHICFGGEDIKLNANIVARQISALTADQKLDIGTKVVDEIKRIITEKLEQKASGLDVTGQVNISDNVTEIMNSISTTIENSVQNTISNKLDTVVGSENEYTYIVGRDGLSIVGGKCTVELSNVINELSNNITDSALSVVINNESMKKLFEEYKIDTSQSAEGFLSLNLTVVFSVIAAIIAIVFLMMFGGGGKTKIIIFVIVLILVLAGGYWLYSQ